jgi:hypothetical protein
MPYAGIGDTTLPKYVQALSGPKRQQWIAIWNKNFNDCQEKSGDDCEGNSFQLANDLIANSLQFGVNRAGEVKRVQHNGRAYLVSPVVAIRAGVLNGELVPLEEIGKFPQTWNGIPLPVGHPQENGDYISANTPDIEGKNVGRFWNARIESDALKGELWIDIAKAQSLGGDAVRVLQRLEAGRPLEVSTAYFRDFTPTSGEYHGEQYSGVASNLRPDHLALLLDEPGACSWRDGCGAPRVNAKDETMDLNEQTIGGVITNAIRDFIKPFRKETEQVDERQNLIDTLVAGGCPVSKQALENMELPDLQALTEMFIKNNASPKEGTIGKGVSQAKTPPAKAGVVPVENLEIEEIESGPEDEMDMPAPVTQPVTIAPDLATVLGKLSELAGMLQANTVEVKAQGKRIAAIESGLNANAEKEKVEQINDLAANQKIFNREELARFDLPTLKKLSASLLPANFIGRGMPANHRQFEGEWDPYQSNGEGK